ncbi:type III PLP-dependent enzyme [Roseivivax sp.]
MVRQERIFSDETAHLAATRPEGPVLYFRPGALSARARAFRAGFPGEVTYAVKANPARAVLETLAAEGIAAFDVASPEEIDWLASVLPGAALHYNNPVRAKAEIAHARRLGVRSWSVDRPGELAKLGELRGQEVSVRLKLPVKGAAYEFGAKFGADPEAAVLLLVAAAEAGARPSICFHPGTQCADPAAWVAYIEAAARVAREAGVRLSRLNVGGGFPAARGGAEPDLGAIFTAIGETVARAFGPEAPALLCEPGRALVADAASLAVPVKATSGASVFLADGIYGHLAEWRDLSAGGGVTCLSPEGRPRQGPMRPRIVFGPTCDSLDRLPEPLPLPEDLAEGDYLVIPGMGAYSSAIATAFNGYGRAETVTLSGAGGPTGH